jgi:lipopolysaccharide export LptBFGC system permease protein LptF
MSRTLFWYIFKDLLRIFMLASGALSGIMSFGGLLRPLYEQGLNIGQVGAILGWSGPAMTAYSLPIAALFATTIVYGRLGADNEITACRAAGISHLEMAIPAFLLGLITALVGLVLLCFVVPYSMLKVERILYSNLAELVANQIERTHQIRFDQNNRPVTVFAQNAEVLAEDPSRPRDQAVRLFGPLFVSYAQTEKGKPLVPESFYTASTATAFIRQDSDDDDVTLEAELVGGMKFPRDFGGDVEKSMQVWVGATSVGPIPLPSPVRENTKFMDIMKLRDVETRPELSRRVRDTLREFIHRDQQQLYLQGLADRLNGSDSPVQLVSGAERYLLIRGSDTAQVQRDRLILTATAGGARPKLVQLRGEEHVLEVAAAEVRIKSIPNPERRTIGLDIDLIDCDVKVGGEKSSQRMFTRPLIVPMPIEVAALVSRPAADYINLLSREDRNRLQRDLYKIRNSVISEIWARFSFSVSCLILVAVGCALGMMFKSGNFLSAFAVCAIPALLCIALIVTGQHTAENIPNPLPPNWTNSLKLGLTIIWSGNVIVAAAAIVLLTRLQRQ